ncbi:MAG TPA: FAD-dependent oxidoreductase [Candidatus Binatia bacterium]|nr:FAD-dependent oxidoreductase [Candidatus Binatia bacterium]
MRLDLLIFGGGAAGLWCLHRFRRAGYVAILLESKALANGQTIQAQGIIHGGGKYALRGVRDFTAVQATKEMPERWRRSLAGEIEPDLRATKVISDRCHLWLPRGSMSARALSWGLMPLIAKAGLLSTPPQQLPHSMWPAALRDSALAVYTLEEPVVATGSLIEVLAKPYRKWIFAYNVSALRFAGEQVQIGDTFLEPRSILFVAGTGNADLMCRAGIRGELMQCRPLRMVLLRGATLPELFGHCITRGKTQLTVTTPAQGIWQVGGEIAEQLAHEENLEYARQMAMSEIQRCFPGLDLSDVEIAFYSATRAEAKTAAQKRPSGVHVSQLAPRIVVGWPTKLSMTPILAEEAFTLLHAKLKKPGGYEEPSAPWPTPPVARYPWEEAEWFTVR